MDGCVHVSACAQVDRDGLLLLSISGIVYGALAILNVWVCA